MHNAGASKLRPKPLPLAEIAFCNGVKIVRLIMNADRATPARIANACRSPVVAMASVNWVRRKPAPLIAGASLSVETALPSLQSSAANRD